MASSLIPDCYMHRRESKIAGIMTALNVDSPITQSECTQYMALIDLVPCYKERVIPPTSYRDVLTKSRSYLAPPVKACIQPKCSMHGRPGSLYSPHPPIQATVFTLSGPVPATKISLRCKGCSTIYNYNKYGKKNTEGERLYDCQRDLVEVTDVVYCSREMYSLFCSLRYLLTLIMRTTSRKSSYYHYYILFIY